MTRSWRRLHWKSHLLTVINRSWQEGTMYTSLLEDRRDCRHPPKRQTTIRDWKLPAHLTPVIY